MSFSRDMGRFKDKTKGRIRSTYRNSVQELGERTNLHDGKGGFMRVDTGFLRASQAYGLNQMPSGPTENKGNKRYGENDRIGDGPTLILGQWQPGDTVFIGWAANYARFREAKDGFVRLPAQKWDSIVTKNAQQAKARGL